MATIVKTVRLNPPNPSNALLRVYQLCQVAAARRQEADAALLRYLRDRLEADEATQAKLAQVFDAVASIHSMGGDDQPKIEPLPPVTPGNAVSHRHPARG